MTVRRDRTAEGAKKALLGAAKRTFARPLSFFKEKVVPLQQFKEI